MEGQFPFSAAVGVRKTGLGKKIARMDNIFNFYKDFGTHLENQVPYHTVDHFRRIVAILPPMFDLEQVCICLFLRIYCTSLSCPMKDKNGPFESLS